MKLRKHKVLLFLVVLLSLSKESLKAQVSLNIPAIAAPLMKPEMLWNLVIIDQQMEDISGRIKIVIKDNKQQVIYSALSTNIIISHGAKNITYSSVLPITNIYSAQNGQSSWLKVGNYNVCYSFIQQSHSGEFTSLSDDCIDFIVEPLSPPLLNYPDDKSQIADIRPNLSWLPPAPYNIFENLKYECKIVGLNEGQTASEAIRDNTPVFFINDINVNNTIIPGSYKALETGKNYVWQVAAYDGNYSIKTEVWKFSVLKDSILEIIAKTPFVKMSQNKIEFATMQQGYIKVVLPNYSNDLQAKLSLIEEGYKSSKPIMTVDININSGVNYLTKEFTTKKKLDENKIYQLVWINSKNERWIVRFKPKYYNN